MLLTNEQILARLDAAMKGITTTTTAGDSVLNETQLKRYIRMLQKKTVVLPEARQVIMDSNVMDIDQVGFAGRVLRPAAAEGSALSQSDWASPTFSQNKLTAVEAQGIVSITDKLMRRNIEKPGFENTLVDMIGERTGIDLEELGLSGDTGSSDPYLAINDGWLKLARRTVPEVTDAAYDDASTPLFSTGVGETTQDVLYDKVPIEAGTWEIYTTSTSGTLVGHDDGNGVIVQDAASGISGAIDYESGAVSLEGLTASTDYFTKYTAQSFDYDGDDFPEDMFDAMIYAIPKPYFMRRPEWRIYVPFWVEDAYRNKLRARGTALGDSAQTGGARLVYKDVPVVYVPNMPNGRSWLTHPDNTVYGIFHRVELEREREAKAKRTDFVVNMEVDYNYEEEEATVKAEIFD